MAAGLADRLGSIARRGGQLAGRVAEGVKEVTPKRLLRDAIDAQSRGNVGAAFFLARESVQSEPGDVEADAFFWDVAIQYGEPGDAAESAARLVRHHAGQGGGELAAQYFRELVGVAEPALVEPTVLIRLLPDLVAGLERAEADVDAEPAELGTDAPGASHEERLAPDPQQHRAAVMCALGMCVDPENTALSPGLAMRVAELARPYDTDVSLKAARVALSAPDVHEAKRAKLVALIRELDPDADLEGEEALEVDEADLAAVAIDLDVSETRPVVSPDAARAETPPHASVAAPEPEVERDGLVLSPEQIEDMISGEVMLEDEGEDGDEGDALVAPDPTTVPISEAEADRLTSFLEPADDELEAVTVGDITDSSEIDEIEVLPELQPIDESDPSRNHPSRIESPVVEALSEDEVDRMRARIERALGNGNGGGSEPAAQPAEPIRDEPVEA